MKDYYKILGVSENASQDEIKKAYRKLSLKNHPDKGGDPDVFKEISSAYDTLSDEEKRQQYEMERKFGSGGGHGFPGGSFPHGMSMGGFPDEILRNLFGSSMGGDSGNMRQNGFPFNFHMGGMDGNPNVRIFRNGVEVTQNQMNKPVPIVKTIEVSLEQSYNGYKSPIEIERWIQEDNVKRIEKETLYVDIPQGIDNNEIIIIRNKGNIISESNKGDIKLFIKIVNTTQFQRRGLDLIYIKNISLHESLCGFKFSIKYLDGKNILINNTDRVIKPGYQKAIPGMGMRRDNSKGSMIIQFDVDYPEQLNDKQKELINKAFE